MKLELGSIAADSTWGAAVYSTRRFSLKTTWQKPLEWNPKGAAFVALVRLLEKSPKAAGDCFCYHACHVALRPLEMELKRSCICRLGEAKNNVAMVRSK
jgi:hypothetical protein